MLGALSRWASEFIFFVFNIRNIILRILLVTLGHSPRPLVSLHTFVSLSYKLLKSICLPLDWLADRLVRETYE